jgi:hypothetical protein
MALSNDERQDLDNIAWIAWGKMKAEVPDKPFTDRDREMFFVGFGYGRVDVLKTPPRCDCGRELSPGLCPACDRDE